MVSRSVELRYLLIRWQEAKRLPSASLRLQVSFCEANSISLWSLGSLVLIQVCVFMHLKRLLGYSLGCFLLSMAVHVQKKRKKKRNLGFLCIEQIIGKEICASSAPYKLITDLYLDLPNELFSILPGHMISFSYSLSIVDVHWH